MANRIIKWGIIGAGRIAHTFAQDIAYVEGAEIIAVASRNSVPDEFAAQYNIRNSYQGYDALLADNDVDAVYIATPHSCHLDNCIEALNAGKHVVCEKPLVLNTHEASILKSIIDKCNNQFFMEGMWSYFLPAIREAMMWINEGRIGSIRQLKVDFGYPLPYNPELREYDVNLGGGCLLEMGVYPVALAWLLLNKMPERVRVYSHFADNGADDEIVALCDYVDQAVIIGSSFRSKLQNHAYIIGEDGFIEIPDFWRATECHLYHIEERVDTYHDSRDGTGFEFQIQHASDCIRDGKTESDIMPFEKSFGFQELMEVILKTARNS